MNLLGTDEEWPHKYGSLVYRKRGKQIGQVRNYFKFIDKVFVYWFADKNEVPITPFSSELSPNSIAQYKKQSIHDLGI